jgi:ELWxxDGT repeat protein
MLAFNNAFYFYGAGGVDGAGLWKSDGTAEGTVLVKLLDPYAPTELTGVGGTLFFTATASYAEEPTRDVELWKSDGTEAGTVRVQDTVPRFAPDGTMVPLDLTASGGRVFFVAADASGDVEPWVSNGTPAGTIRLKDANQRPASSVFGEMLAVGDTLYFEAYAGDGTGGLWKSDGTGAGTRLLTRLTSARMQLTDVNGTVFFVGSDPESGEELWKSDGTPEGTVRVKDIDPGFFGSQPFGLTNMNGKLYFNAYGGSVGLWTSDGTEAGTVPVTDSVQPYDGYDTFEAIGNTLYFSGSDSQGRHGLWKTDGTRAGTVPVRLTSSDPIEPDSDWLTNYNGTLVFAGYDEEHGVEPWKSDGTPEGTVRIKDIYAGAFGDNPEFSSGPGLFTVTGGFAYFVATSELGPRLLRTDGTEEGTIDLGVQVAHLFDRAAMGDALYVVGSDGMNAEIMYKTDGTFDGTVPVADFASDPTGEPPRHLTAVGDVVYFTDFNLDSGEELWRTDGSDAGTWMVAEFQSDLLGAGPGDLVSVGGEKLFFSADHPDTGRELWSLDSAGPDRAPSVAGHNLFRNRSSLDGFDPADGPEDDAAVIPDKQPWRPGVAPTFANVSGYGRGINGVMVDVAHLPIDFLFSPDEEPAWPNVLSFRSFTASGTPGAPVPDPSSVSIRRGAGVGGADRISISWDDSAVRGGWLEVTVGLTDPAGVTRYDVFYFGSLVGDTGGGGGPRVDTVDVLRTRINLGRTDATSLARYDFNGDGAINTTDLLLVRNAQRTNPTLAPPRVVTATRATPFTLPQTTTPPPPLLITVRRDWITRSILTP